MKPNVHYDKTRTSAQSPSHIARRLMYARAALAGEYMRSADVPKAYPRAPPDPAYRVVMPQPRRSYGSFTQPGKYVLVDCAQMGGPDGGYLWERYRNEKLTSCGWRKISAEPGCFLYVDDETKEFVRLLIDTDDFLFSSPSKLLLDKVYESLCSEWDLKEQVPISQHMGVSIKRSSEEIVLSVKKHIEQLLDLMGLRNANSVKTPHDPKADLSSRRNDEPQLSPETKLQSQSVCCALLSAR